MNIAFSSVTPLRRLRHRRALILIPLLIACVGLLPPARAVSPPPDGGYPGGNTAEGQDALLSLMTGTYNTAIGIYSLLRLSDGNFCARRDDRNRFVVRSDEKLTASLELERAVCLHLFGVTESRADHRFHAKYLSRHVRSSAY